MISGDLFLRGARCVRLHRLNALSGQRRTRQVADYSRQLQLLRGTIER